MSTRTGRVVVFGGRGFIGAHVVAALSEQGRDFVAPPRSEVDLLDDRRLRALLQDGDTVVNCAGYADAADLTSRGRELLHSSNVVAVRTLLEAAADRRVAHLVHVSSVAAMGRLHGIGIAEEARGPIGTAYAASKRGAEDILAAPREGLAVTILRPTSVFGEGRGLARMLCRLSCLPLVPLPRAGRVLVPFTYVRNVAQAVAHCAGEPACFGQTYIIGDDHSYLLQDIIRGIGARLGCRPVIVPVPKAAAMLAAGVAEHLPGPVALRRILTLERVRALSCDAEFSVQKFYAATGLAPAIGLDDALSRIALWYARIEMDERTDAPDGRGSRGGAHG